MAPQLSNETIVYFRDRNTNVVRWIRDYISGFKRGEITYPYHNIDGWSYARNEQLHNIVLHWCNGLSMPNPRYCFSSLLVQEAPGDGVPLCNLYRGHNSATSIYGCCLQRVFGNPLIIIYIYIYIYLYITLRTISVVETLILALHGEWCDSILLFIRMVIRVSDCKSFNSKIHKIHREDICHLNTMIFKYTFTISPKQIPKLICVVLLKILIV